MIIVWIYGDAFVIGTARQPEYDGANLARRDVVVGSLNYRVGFEGFGWLPDAPHSRTFLDQLATLRWVQENMEHFGGSPGSVAAYGPSIGPVNRSSRSARQTKSDAVLRLASNQPLAATLSPRAPATARARQSQPRPRGEQTG